MAFQRNAGFTSAIPTDPAATAAGYLTPTRYNLPFVVSDAVSGGIPFFSSATTEGTSALLAANAVVLGGGAGAAPLTSSKLSESSTAGGGLVVAAGTATTDVELSSFSRTNNNAAVVRGFEITFTDTLSAAGFLPFHVIGSANGARTLFSVGKTGFLTFGNGFTTGQSTFGTSSNGDITGGSGTNTATHNFYSDSNNNKFQVRAAGVFGWSSNTSPLTAADTGFSRISAGLAGLGTGGAASFAGRLKLTSAIAAGVTVANLNAAPTVGEHQTVTNALAPAVGVAVAAGGAANAGVWWNGAQWTVYAI